MKRVSKANKREKKTKVVEKQSVKSVKKEVKESKLSFYIGKYPFLISISLMLFLCFWVFKDFLFLKKLFFFSDIGSDSINVDYPWMVMFDNMRNEQDFFGWSFYCGLGYPVFSGIVTLISPFVVTNLITEPLAHLFYGNNPAFLKFPYVLFFILCIGITSYFYFKTIGVSKFARIVGSILVPFMGFTIATSSWNTYMDVFNGIFLLFAFEQLYKKNRWYFFPVAIVFLTGNFFNVYMYGLFLIIYMLFRYFSEQVFDFKKLGILSLKMVGLTILGLTLNVVNFSSYLVNAINSPRASGDVSMLEETAKNTLLSDTGYQYSTAILRLFSSDMAGTAENFRGWYNYLEAPLFYCGIICLLLVFQVFNYLSKKEKITYGTFSAFWLLVVLIPVLRHLLHLYLGEYYKVGINFFIPIGLIFMAMQALSRMESENRLNLPVLLISGIGLLSLLFYPYKIENIDLAEPKIRNWAAFFLVTYAVLLFLFRSEKYRSVTKISLLIIIFIELGYFSSVSINSRKAYSAREFKKTEGGYKDNTLPALKYVKSKDQSFFRFEKDYFSGNAMHASLNDAQAQGYFGTTLYSSYNHPYYIKFLKSVNIIQDGVESQTRWAPGLRSRPLLQTMASVKYNVSKSEKPFMLNAGYKTLNKFDDVTLMQNEYFVPFGFCYDAYMSETDFRQLSNLQKDIALLKCCVLDESISTSEIKKNLKKLTASDTVSGFDFPVYSELVEQRKKDTLQITEFKHDKITGNIELKASQLLFFSIPYDENWKAKVDGKAVDPMLVNVGFIGLTLEKGKHKIELFYTPAYFKISFAVSILATILYILLFFVSKEFKMKTKLIGLGVFLIAWAINYFIII